MTQKLQGSEPHFKDQEGRHELSPAGSGDQRTPDKRIGEVAYADKEGKQKKDPKKDSKKDSKPASKVVEKSSLEGPAAYAPHDPAEKITKRDQGSSDR